MAADDKLWFVVPNVTRRNEELLGGTSGGLSSGETTSPVTYLSIRSRAIACLLKISGVHDGSHDCAVSRATRRIDERRRGLSSEGLRGGRAACGAVGVDVRGYRVGAKLRESRAAGAVRGTLR